MKLWTALRSEQRYTLNDYASWVSESFLYNQNWYAGEVQTTLGQRAERIGSDFRGLASQAYASNGIVFSCMLVRQLVFSAIRFQFQTITSGRPSETWGHPSLALLENPWPGGTTQDLLARMIQDADLAGNSFQTVETSLATLGGDGGKELVRLRPDYMGIVLGRRRSGLGMEKLGYVYCEGPEEEDHILLRDEVAHFAPIPDPLASYRGMSWLTPIIREVQADQLMGRHKRMFFENGATPNMVIKHDPATTQEKVKAFRERLDAEHKGASNAYKNLHIGGGADVTVVGANFQQITFTQVQGHGETRVAAAAGTPPILVGLSEGLESATYSNYGQARRRFADGTCHPLWQNAAGSLGVLMAPLMPPLGQGRRLWYDANVPFLREDEKDAAEIAEIQARTIRTYVDGGYTPDSSKRAVMSGDLGLLEHSGLYSVQLQAAGAQASAVTTGDDS